MTKKIIFLVIIGIIIAFGVGFLVGKNLAKKSVVDKSVIEESVVNDFRQKLESKIEQGLIPFSIFPEEITLTSLTGEIVRINENRLEIKIPNNYRGGDFFAYLSEPDFFLKEVKIEEKTKIAERREKEPEQIRKETEAWKEGEPFPEPFQETTLSIKDLKEGMIVGVEATREFRLEETEPIEAAKIIVLP